MLYPCFFSCIFCYEYFPWGQKEGMAWCWLGSSGKNGTAKISYHRRCPKPKPQDSTQKFGVPFMPLDPLAHPIFKIDMIFSDNCLDRHAEKNPDKPALIWEKDQPGTQEVVTYRYPQNIIILLCSVCMYVCVHVCVLLCVRSLLFRHGWVS